MRVTIIGVGHVGSALGRRLSECGHEIVFGVRPGRNVDDLLASCDGEPRAAATPEAVTAGEVAFLAVPADAAVDALAGADLDGRVVVDCNNPLGWDDGPTWKPPAEGSVTARLAAAYPGARWVKGFNTFGAELHRDPDLGGYPVDVQLASDDAEAKGAVAELARSAGFRPVDAGPLRNAAVLENLAVLWIHLAMVGGHGREVGFRLVGRG